MRRHNKKQNILEANLRLENRFISEKSLREDIPFSKKIMLKLKGVSKEKQKYNKEHGLPLDWQGSKEGFYEKMEPRKNYTGSN